MKRRGFTLLEVLVATSIMGIAVVALMGGISSSMRNTGRLAERERAAAVARARMELLLLDRTLPPAGEVRGPIDPVLMGGAQAGWRALISPFEVPPNAGPGSPILERVELEVWWMAGAQRRSLALEGFRKGIIPLP